MNLEDELNRESAAWKPEPGDRLIGTVADVVFRESDYGAPYPLLTIVDDNGAAWDVHAFHTVLRDRIKELRPAVGDRIGIRYDGPKMGGAGREYQGYRVVLDRQPESVSPPCWATAWKPEPGEWLIGIVTNVVFRESDHGSPYPLLTIVDDNGAAWDVHASHAGLRDRLEELRPGIGDRLGLRYDGTKMGGATDPAYHVVLDRQAGSTVPPCWATPAGTPPAGEAAGGSTVTSADPEPF